MNNEVKKAEVATLLVKYFVLVMTFIARVVSFETFRVTFQHFEMSVDFILNISQFVIYKL